MCSGRGLAQPNSHSCLELASWPALWVASRATMAELMAAPNLLITTASKLPLNSSEPTDYSCLRATIGSTRMARRAGM